MNQLKTSNQNPREQPCPHCGELIRTNARFCRYCGANEEQGWQADDSWSDIPIGGYAESEHEYEEFIAGEFPQHANQAPKRVIWCMSLG